MKPKAIISLLLFLLTLSVHPIQALAQEGSVCGWIDFVPNPPGGQTDYSYVMTLWNSGETIQVRQPLYVEYDDPQEQRWADQFWAVITEPGYYQIINPVMDNDWIYLFEQVTRVETCGVATPTTAPVPMPTTPPVPVSPALDVIDFRVEPAQVSVFEMARITVVIENKGAPLNQPLWGYTGEVILESANGEVLERYSFAKGDSSFITPVVEGGRINFEKWRLTVKVWFATAVSNGRVIVSLRPNIQQQSEIRGEGRLTVNPGLSGLSCTSVIVNKLVGPFSPPIRKDLLDAITAGLQAARCKDGDVACAAPPLVKAFVKILGRNILGEIGNIIAGIWGVFDTDALQACRGTGNWMWQLLREFNKQGVPISVSSVHSPMTILVTNSAGQRAGFVSDDEIVTEIPDSRVIEWKGDKYVIYPADPNVTITLLATGDGSVGISLIEGQSGREVNYSNISVSDGDKAWIDLNDAQTQLLVDTNDDGNPDETYSGAIEVLRVPEMPTASPSTTSQPTGICGGSLGLIMLPLFIVVITRSFRKLQD